MIKKLKTNPKSETKKEISNGMVSLQKDLISKKLKNKEISQRLKFSLNKLKKSDRSGRYILDRKYKDYNLIFKQILNNTVSLKSLVFRRDIISTLKMIEQKYKKKEINVLDDGAGRGYFLSQLKEKWNTLKKEKKVSADLKTTAVSLTKSFSTKNIDFKKIGNVINFIPERKYDLIISVYGGFHYTQTPLKKEVLLKYLYSLNNGGVAIFSFNPILLRTNLDKEHRMQVLKALEKRGFKADFSYLPSNFKKKSPDLPQVYLFVEREK
ncbi:hypothetical protein GW835_01125 [archaeon]|nr:hypothetical protein [archaeon]NCP79155.1 hypothetical protein [archaeon]NCP97898.1 hypothetical protein [archaeon]NCQ06922.1 hypothetical protein [archaeon]NCQ50718.1 hypothetical protein [archaeon]